jgi:DNA-binding MarR family transcriptional regulator
MISEDTELEVLECIHRSRSAIHQRDLARIIGLSLGMTNTIVRKLAQKGLLQIRKVNNRNVQYAVSPQGMEKIAHRSYRYLKRTIKNVVYYREAIDRLVREAARDGFRQVVLVGRSDLDFIVEHFCAKHAVGYARATEAAMGSAQRADSGGERFILFSENARTKVPERGGCASLRELFLAAVAASTPVPAPEEASR